MACSTGVDRAAIGDGKEEAVVLWPGICSTIVSFRYHFILGVSRFLTVCETSQPCLSLSLSIFFAISPLTPLPSASVSEMPLCNAFYSSSSFLFSTFASSFRGEFLSVCFSCFASIFGTKSYEAKFYEIY